MPRMSSNTMLLAIATTTIYLLQQPMFTLTSAFNTYSESTLQRLAQASSLSYLSLDKMSSSPYYEKCQLQPLIQVVDAESESGATIFRALPKNIDDNDNDDHKSNTQKIIVACRGSANPKNFGTNLKFNLVPANRLSQNDIPEDALVHDGFQSASVGLWKELSQPLETLLNGDDDTEIVFTGHSLGAATALLCATHYNASHKNQHLSSSSSSSSISPPSTPPPSIITFGGPKLCNSILARHLRNDALEGWNILHLVHSKDPVLANNQMLWEKLGFEDVGIELECDPNSPVVFDAEDGKVPEKSLFGGFAWNIVDHCKYMGVFVGPRAFF